MPAQTQIILSRGAFSLVVAANPPALTLQRGSTTLLSWPADALQLGRVDAVDNARNYDPYYLYLNDPLFQPPAGLRWLSPQSAQLTSSNADSATLTLTYPEDVHATLTIQATVEGRFEARLQPTAGGPIAYFRLRPRADHTEGFYGLGESFDDVNQRGKLRAMQLELDGNIESSDNEAHVPIPFLIGTTGWGLFVNSPYPATFDVARQADDLVEATFATAAASNEGLVFHILAAAEPLDLTKHYYDLTGLPQLPARWALGPWIWRDENRDQAEVENDVHTLRELDLATTALWVDRPYASGVNTFDFKSSQFPDPSKMIQVVHDYGLRFALWHTPYLDRSDPTTLELRQFASANEYYPVRSGLLLNGWGRPIDLTKPEAYQWWQGLIRRYTDLGVEGFKLDYGEDVAVGVSTARSIWQFHDGSDERTMHGRYQLFYHQVYKETLPETGGLLLCRHATIGDQRNVSVIWPGDLDASFAKHREEVTDGNSTYIAVGGLPASMIAGITLGPSGFPFYGADTGGYRHSPPDKELFTRWFEQTALSSVMQIGTSTNNVAWEFSSETGFDQEMLDWYRRYTRLHLRLFPYEWTYAQRIALDGRPIQRPLGLAYPEVGQHPSDEYLFGDDLLVAPVVTRDQRQRPVIFPAGEWINWWTEQSQPGSTTAMIDAPLDTLPLFVRRGAIIPLLRPTIDAMAPTTQPDMVDSYATTPGRLYVRVVPGGDTSFDVFDGAHLAQRLQIGDVTDRIELDLDGGTEFSRGAVFEVFGYPVAQVMTVADNGAPMTRSDSLTALETMDAGWTLDGRLYVKVGTGSHRIVAAVSQIPN